MRPMLIGIAFWALVVATATTRAASASAPRTQRPGRILIIRGIFNVFSFGMDKLACTLTQRGYRVDVTPPSLAPVLAEEIERDYLRDPSIGPLVIIGHSLGGRQCCSIPWGWREKHIPVKLVVILDSNPGTAVADNVERCVNLYVTNDLGVFHGRAVWSVNPRAELVNVDVTKIHRPPGVPAVDHLNIDDSDWIQAMVVREVERSLSSHDATDLEYGSAKAQQRELSRRIPDERPSAANPFRQAGTTHGTPPRRYEPQAAARRPRSASSRSYPSIGSSRY